jgi:hypothetical protein
LDGYSFYRRILRAAFAPVFVVLEVLEVVLFAIGGLLYRHPEIEAQAKPFLVLVPLAMLLVTFLVSLARAPHVLYGELGVEHESTVAELRRMKERRLEVTFGEGAPFEQWGPGSYHGYRVAVRAVGGQSVEGVHVELIRLNPPDNAYVPFVLHLKGNDPPQEPKLRFDLHPGETEYVDVVCNYGDASNRSFCFYMADPNKPNQMPAKPYVYEATLAAYGRDVVEPAQVQFSIFVDEQGHLSFNHRRPSVVDGSGPAPFLG